MLEFGGEFGRVRLGGGPQGSGVYWVDDGSHWNKFDPNSPSGALNQNLDGSVRERQIAYGMMGLVRVSTDPERQHADVRWNVRTVQLSALDAVSNYLEDFCRNYTVSLSFYIDAWHHENIADVREAVNRIQSSVNFRHVALMDSVFVKKAGTYGFPWSTDLIRTGLLAYEQSKGYLSHPTMQKLMPYLLVYKPYEVEDQMIIANAGPQSGYAKFYGNAWNRHTHGARYDSDTPGAYYSHRVSEAYAGVMAKNEPRLDHIRAILERPNDEPRWASYQRLLFRGRLVSGAPVLVCLSDLTQHIDIPFLGA